MESNDLPENNLEDSNDNDSVSHYVDITDEALTDINTQIADQEFNTMPEGMKDQLKAIEDELSDFYTTEMLHRFHCVDDEDGNWAFDVNDHLKSTLDLGTKFLGINLLDFHAVSTAEDSGIIHIGDLKARVVDNFINAVGGRNPLSVLVQLNPEGQYDEGSLFYISRRANSLLVQNSPGLFNDQEVLFLSAYKELVNDLNQKIVSPQFISIIDNVTEIIQQREAIIGMTIGDEVAAIEIYRNMNAIESLNKRLNATKKESEKTIIQQWINDLDKRISYLTASFGLTSKKALSSSYIKNTYADEKFAWTIDLSQLRGARAMAKVIRNVDAITDKRAAKVYEIVGKAMYGIPEEERSKIFERTMLMLIGPQISILQSNISSRNKGMRVLSQVRQSMGQVLSWENERDELIRNGESRIRSMLGYDPELTDVYEREVFAKSQSDDPAFKFREKVKLAIDVQDRIKRNVQTVEYVDTTGSAFNEPALQSTEPIRVEELFEPESIREESEALKPDDSKPTGQQIKLPTTPKAPDAKTVLRDVEILGREQVDESDALGIKAEDNVVAAEELIVKPHLKPQVVVDNRELYYRRFDISNDDGSIYAVKENVDSLELTYYHDDKRLKKIFNGELYLLEEGAPNGVMKLSRSGKVSFPGDPAFGTNAPLQKVNSYTDDRNNLVIMVTDNNKPLRYFTRDGYETILQPGTTDTIMTKKELDTAIAFTPFHISEELLGEWGRWNQQYPKATPVEQIKELMKLTNNQLFFTR